jgi:hypothetical protein
MAMTEEGQHRKTSLVDGTKHLEGVGKRKT